MVLNIIRDWYKGISRLVQRDFEIGTKRDFETGRKCLRDWYKGSKRLVEGTSRLIQKVSEIGRKGNID